MRTFPGGRDTAPLISIIVPAFNVAQFLPLTLDSILAQTEQRWELVIVDDGSTDTTLAAAQEYAVRDRRVTVLGQPNGGASAARNAGFAASDSGSEFVTFMDADDVWLPAALATLLARAAATPSAAGAHGLAEFIDAAGAPLRPGEFSSMGRNRLGLQGRQLIPLQPDMPTDFNVLVNGNVLFPPGLVLVRRDVYNQTGPFDVSFLGPEDWDMLIRISRYGPLCFVDQTLLLYRRHGSNLGAQPGVSRQAWLVRCKAFYSPENTPKQRRDAVRGWRADQRRLRKEAASRTRAAVSSRDPRGILGGFARIAVTSIRWARGFPLPRVRSERLSW